jgi:pimeloyl-ACP methyl ester carboxylesterase
MEPRFIDVAGTRTRYYDAGEGPVLVLVHGGSYGSYWNADDWELNLPVLARDFRVIAPDKLGCGYTDNPSSDDDYLIGSMVAHLRQLIAVLDLGSVHIAGHSRGGYAVTRLAIESPELVSSLTIVDSSSLVSAPNPQYDAWEAEAAGIPDLRERHRYLITANSWSGDHITDHYLDVITELVRLPKTIEARQKMDGGLRARFGRDLVERQAELHAWIREGRLRCPTELIWGYEDPSATMQRCGLPAMDLILSSVSEAEMHVLNHAGHSVMRERADAFNRTIRDFVMRHPASSKPRTATTGGNSDAQTI